MPVRRTLTALVGVLVLPLVGACGSSAPGSPAGPVVDLHVNDGYAGALVDPGYPLPTQTFTDTDGGGVDLRRRGPPAR